jgi:nucleoside-diphosphate-sugar epimerase
MILITGGGGFYGRNIARYLIDKGKEVLLLQRSPIEVPSFLAPYWEKQVRGVRGDVQSLPFLMGLVKDYHVKSIIHLAGVSRGAKLPVHEIIQVNVLGTINVLETARIFGLRRVTFASSNTVYRGKKEPPKGPYHEDLDLPVISGRGGFIPYTKRAAEQMCMLYAQECGLSVCMVRGGNGYGPASHRANPPDIMVPDALQGKPVDFSQTPENSTLAPVYAKDLAKGYGLLHLAESLPHSIYNISSGNEHTFSEVVRMIKDLIPGAEIRLGPTSTKVSPYRPSIERAKNDVGYVPDYPDFKQGVKAYIEYLKYGKY